MHFFPQIDPFPLSKQQWALKRYAGLNFEMDAQSSSVAAIDKFKKTALVLGKQGKYTYLTGRWIKEWLLIMSYMVLRCMTGQSLE